MNYKDFDNNFLFISRSNMRDEVNFTSSLYRPIIGKNDIGKGLIYHEQSFHYHHDIQ